MPFYHYQLKKPHAFPKRDLRNMTTPDRGVIAVADLAMRNPGPMVGGPLGAYRGSIPPVMGRVIAAQVCIGRKRVLPRIDPRKILRGCTPGTRMTLHHHPDRVATSDFENSNLNSGYGRPRQSQVIQRSGGRPDRGVIAVADLACGNPGPMVGAPRRVSGFHPAGYGTGNSRTSLYRPKRVLPRIDPRKILRGCTPGTRMTLHHHPDRVATSDFENSNFEFGVWSTASITTCGNPSPMVGPLGAYRVPSPPVMGRVIAAQVCIGRKRVLPRIDPRKIFARVHSRYSNDAPPPSRVLIIQIQNLIVGSTVRHPAPGPTTPLEAP
ncbi:hypothetical protein PAPYR_11675 [Paratrimastix pyriformis]|uniref:Uncharacterized protein n=1 Tax=Paratrimastix pyriformis TaxID=342808 RepID=A0ABQ8U379_9EUKA|nr:hypothetical protein PAPYR_11675 [Paratrimastix pyriformis]